VVESLAMFIGCRKVLSRPSESYTMLEHEALPSKCLTMCRNKDKVFALVNGKVCYCTSDNSSFEVIIQSLCSKLCQASYKYRCGGDADDVCSVYRTGEYID